MHHTYSFHLCSTLCLKSWYVWTYCMYILYVVCNVYNVTLWWWTILPFSLRNEWTFPDFAAHMTSGSRNRPAGLLEDEQQNVECQLGMNLSQFINLQPTFTGCASHQPNTNHLGNDIPWSLVFIKDSYRKQRTKKLTLQCRIECAWINVMLSVIIHKRCLVSFNNWGDQYFKHGSIRYVLNLIL